MYVVLFVEYQFSWISLSWSSKLIAHWSAISTDICILRGSLNWPQIYISLKLGFSLNALKLIPTDIDETTVNILNTKFGFLGSYLLRRPLYSLNRNLDRRCCLCVLLSVSKAWKYLTRLSLHSISEPFGHLHLIISKYISKLFNIINCCMHINWSYGNRDELLVRVRNFVWN